MDTKHIVTIIIGVIFIVSFIFSIFNAGRLLSEGIKQVIGYDDCYYSRPKMISPDGNVTSEVYQDEFYCANDKKRNIAESLAYLVISLPFTILFYVRLMKLRKW